MKENKEYRWQACCWNNWNTKSLAEPPPDDHGLEDGWTAEDGWIPLNLVGDTVLWKRLLSRALPAATKTGWTGSNLDMMPPSPPDAPAAPEPRGMLDGMSAQDWRSEAIVWKGRLAHAERKIELLSGGVDNLKKRVELESAKSTPPDPFLMGLEVAYDIVTGKSGP